MDNAVIVSKIIRSSRKTISIEINKNAEVIVRANFKTPEKIIKSFINEKKDWILDKKKEMEKRLEQQVDKEYQEGEQVMIFGRNYTLNYGKYDFAWHVDHKENDLKINEKFRGNIRENLFIILNSLAHKYLKLKTVELANKFGLKINKIKISKASTRWGSCSSKKNINLSWKLIMAPEEVSIYVIVHELAHLVHHDHSPNFWDLVAQWYPDYKKHRKWLKANGHLLEL